jgi:hypothetical protein
MVELIKNAKTPLLVTGAFWHIGILEANSEVYV